MRIEPILLGLDARAFTRIRPAGVALSDEAPHAGGARGFEEIRRAFGAQAIRGREFLIEMPEIGRARQRGHLMDHRFRPRRLHGRHHRRAIQAICHHRLCPSRS